MAEAVTEEAPPVHPYVGKTEVVKKVHIFTNGDKFFAGKDFVVNPRQLRSFEAFLNQVTTTLNPTFGAVRSIRTPNQGHRVDDLTLLESGKSYVASGSRKFVRLGYAQIATLSLKSNNASNSQSPRESVLKRKIQASGRIRKIKLEPVAVHVYANGETREPPKRLLVQPWIERDWSAVLALVNDKVKLVSGAVRRLVELNSKQEVTSVKELKHDSAYVALGKEKFKDTEYGVPTAVLSPSYQQKRRYPQLAPLKKKPTNTSDTDIASSAAASSTLAVGAAESGTVSADTKGTDASGHGSPEVVRPHPPSEPRKPRSNVPTYQNRVGILIRPLKHKRELPKEDKVIDLDKDEGGLYKAKNSNVTAADTVDDAGAKTEIPVDAQPAEEVVETARAARLRRRRRIQRKRAAIAGQRVQRALLNAAAARIQGAARGFLSHLATARRSEALAAQAKLESAQRTAAAIQIQTAYRSHRSRAALRERRRRRMASDNRKAAAALKIQAAYRGHRARAAVRAQRKERETMVAAAVKIQAAYRGYRSRKLLRSRRRERAAATRIQAAYRGHRVRAELVERRVENAKRSEVAAVRIQAAYRGHRARAALRETREKRAAESVAAATKIQAAYRGHRARAVLRETRQKETAMNVAATKIQAVYRGHRSRTLAKNVREEEARKQRAAVKIQAAYRGHRARAAVRSSRRRDEAKASAAAVKIQAAFRGYRERNSLKTRREEERKNKAATKIQAVYRGHRARLAAETQRLALAHAVRRHVAAVQIQASYRKYRGRAQRDAALKERALRAEAATKIQSTFRGYRARKAIADSRRSALKEEPLRSSIAGGDAEAASEQQSESRED